jgi:hypothetical protein
MGDWDGIEKPILGVPKMRRGERVRYVPNHPSFGAFMKSDQVRDPTAEVAEDIALLAKEFSPQSKRGGDQEGRRMRDQFKVVKNAGFIKVSGNIRVKVEVENPARSAAPNEFGTRKNKRYRMLGRAGAVFGDFKPEGGPGGDA